MAKDGRLHPGGAELLPILFELRFPGRREYITSDFANIRISFAKLGFAFQ